VAGVRSERRARSARVWFSTLFVWALAATAQAQSFRVEWNDDRLSVAASNAALPAVLAEVSRQANVRFVGLDRISGTLDADVNSALLLDALETLLADVNYVMSRPPANQPDARLVIWLHPRSGTVAAAASGGTPAEEGTRATSPIPTTDADAAKAALLEKVRMTDPGPWLTATKAKDPLVRMQALEKLAAQDQYETLAAQILEEALEDSDEGVRDQAFQLLAVHATEDKVLDRIEGLLAHPNAAVRLTAVSALRSRTGDEVKRLLNRALGDDSQAVRIIAGEILRDADLK